MTRKLFISVILAVIAVNVAIGVWLFFRPGSHRALPNPNGYDDFVKAGQMIAPGYSYDYKTMSKEDLAAFVRTNEAALKMVRQGLEHECCVSNDYSPEYLTWHVTNQMQMKGLALDLCAEGRLKALQGNTNDAVGSYLDAIRFGQESSRGGVMILKLGGIACESPGREDLKAIIGSLSATKCREVVHALGTVDAKEEPIEENMKQEAQWMRAATTVRERIEGLFDYQITRKDKNEFIKGFQTNVLRRRQMTIAFAARAYELEKGKPPQSAAELVPDYLKAVPKDPATGKELSLLGK